MEKPKPAVLALLALCSLALPGQGGPLADRVIVVPRSNPTILLKDLVAGSIDLIGGLVEPAEVAALPAADRDRLLLASIPAMSWSLILNPATGSGAPLGLVRGSDGVERFNPFAIPAVRQALSRLIDRRKVVEEICRSRGEPMFTMVRPDQPGGLAWNRAALEMGFRERGDPSAAAGLRGALQRAAADPAMRGRLALVEGQWRFDGKPLSLRFLIRADDAAGRLLLGRSVAALLETQGFAVERLEYARARCNSLFRETDPADLAWSIYTEGWGAGGEGAWHEETFAEMYCPFYGAMPGGEGRGERWRYAHPVLDELGQDLLFGRFPDEAAWKAAAGKAMRLALEESVRVFVAGRDMAIAANAERLGSMPLYNLSSGFDPWTWRSASPRAGPDGRRVLRVGVQVSGGGSPFSYAWDPLGVDGFASTYQWIVLGASCDLLELADPARGIPVPNRHRLIDRAVDPAGLPVPAAALAWDGPGHRWKPVLPGTRAKARLVFDYDPGPWQDGRAVSVADVLWELSALFEWSRKDGESDAAWDPGLEDLSGPWLAPFVAVEVLGERRLAVYGDASWLWDRDRLRSSLAAGPGVVPWPIDEALESLVLNGGRSGTKYRFNPYEEGFAEVDLAAPSAFADLEAELERLAEAGAVPPRLAGTVTPAGAAAARAAALRFMRERGHALDSNGPWILDRVDYAAGAVELSAFPAYPFPPDRARRLFSGGVARIDLLGVPANPSRKAGFTVTGDFSSVTFPEGRAGQAGAGVEARLVVCGAGAEVSVPFVRSGGGRFTATLSPADLAPLAPGPCILIVEALDGDSLPVQRSELILLTP